jgi:hypothetical protein
MTDETARWLRPEEVSIVRNPDGEVHAYLWEPEDLDADWRLNPLLIDCGCRHCGKGRMCRDMADLFRRCARQDDRLIRKLRAR